MEKCEFNPVTGKPATYPKGDGDCENNSNVLIGGFHVCFECSRHIFFKRFKKITLLRDTIKEIEIIKKAVEHAKSLDW